jgi:hypothetical protein
MSVEGEQYFETSPCATTSKTNNRKFQDIWQKEFSWQLTAVYCQRQQNDMYIFTIFLLEICKYN